MKSRKSSYFIQILNDTNISKPTKKKKKKGQNKNKKHQ